MKTSSTKKLIYDPRCGMCLWYTGAMIRAEIVAADVPVSFENFDRKDLLDLQRARHEVALVDTSTGLSIYGLDALTTIFADRYPSLRSIIRSSWFKALINPIYFFISYNRRIITADVQEPADAYSFAPDFNLTARVLLICAGSGYVALSIYIFSVIMSMSPWLLIVAVGIYFMALVIFDISAKATVEEKWNYLAHLAMVGFFEGTFFVLTALLARLSGLNGLMFAGQGAGRILAVWLHARRVNNNSYSRSLNYVFAAGAASLVLLIVILKK